MTSLLDELRLGSQQDAHFQSNYQNPPRNQNFSQRSNPMNLHQDQQYNSFQKPPYPNPNLNPNPNHFPNHNLNPNLNHNFRFNPNLRRNENMNRSSSFSIHSNYPQVNQNYLPNSNNPMNPNHSINPNNFVNPLNPPTLPSWNNPNAPFSQDKIPCTISWPVLHYSDGQFTMQLLFTRKNHIVTIHPITSEVLTYRPIDSILRVSYDTSVQDLSTITNDYEELSLYKVFRIIFKKKASSLLHGTGQMSYQGNQQGNFNGLGTKNLKSDRNSDILIFLSKDGNEIVNALVSKMRQIKARHSNFDNEFKFSDTFQSDQKPRPPLPPFPGKQDQPVPESGYGNENHGTNLQNMFDPNLPKNGSPMSQFSPQSQAHSQINYGAFGNHINSYKNYDPLASYRFTIHSGLYQYQVFGVDKSGKLYPHSLTLFSHFVRHVDSRNKRTFAQHIYEHILSVDLLEHNRIQIKYAYDNPYVFICADQDRAELFCILKGRVFMYQLLKANLGLDPFDDISSYSDDESPISEKRIQGNGFPSSFSYEDERIANEDPYKYDPDMWKAIMQLNGKSITLNLDEQDIDSIHLGNEDEDIDVSVHLTNIQLGMEVWKAKKIVPKKSASMSKIFLRFEKECVAKWGSKRNKIKNSANIIQIITGEDAQFEQTKANKEYAFILKAENPKDDLYCVARDQNEYKSWTLGVKFYLNQKEKD